MLAVIGNGGAGSIRLLSYESLSFLRVAGRDWISAMIKRSKSCSSSLVSCLGNGSQESASAVLRSLSGTCTIV